MNRNITNAIRTVMDEWLPPFIRDSKWFMYPFFYYWYRGDKATMEAYMNFKANVYRWTTQEYEDFYINKRPKSRAASRPTDLNAECIQYMLAHFHPEAKTIIDIGCGNGYFLQQVAAFDTQGKYELHACDVMASKHLGERIAYHQGNIESLPFADKSFDVVTCHHTIEHIPSPHRAVAELKRIARKQILLVTPRQRYYYYTLDEHVNFFPVGGMLEHLMETGAPFARHECLNLKGDWMYVGIIE
jgi:SAM-dependent methyltransferase